MKSKVGSSSPTLGPPSLAQPAPRAAPPPEAGVGWYVYGVTWNDAAAHAELAGGPGLDGRGSVRVLPCRGLAAVVSPVAVAELTAEALQARSGETTRLEMLVRGHDLVVRDVHRRRPILPARFGRVYAGVQNVVAALDGAYDALSAQLRRVDGCDEWEVRLSAGRPALEQSVAASAPVRRLREELAGASPGRAFFLRRQMAEAQASASEQALRALAQEGYSDLARHAVAGRPAATRAAEGESAAEVQVLRAAFLVRRAERDAFFATLERLAESHAGVRCAYSGPWPPYSFAAPDEG